jgi:glycosyltransferase involved in cell wall biosynthesis
MSIGLYLDVQTLQSPSDAERGLGRYVRNHALALVRQTQLVRRLALNPLLPAIQDIELEASTLLGWNTAADFRRLSEEGPLAYYAMSITQSVWYDVGQAAFPPHVIRDDVPFVATLYDAILLAHPMSAAVFTSERWRRMLTRFELMRSADLVLAISESARRDGIELLDLDPARVHVIGSGVSEYFQPASDEERPRAIVADAIPQVDRPFILMASAVEPRKNVETVLDAYAALPRDLRESFQVVVAGRGEFRYVRRLRERLDSLGVDQRSVIFTGWIPDELLRALYQTARLFVFSSFYEGFGLPVAEAAACGCPAITGRESSLPDIIGWGESTFDIHEPDSVAALLERALADASFHQRLTEAATASAPNHRWPVVAERTVNALQTLDERSAGPSTGASPTDRRAIALVLDWPDATPVHGGRLEFAAALAQVCDVSLFTSSLVGRPRLKDAPAVPIYPAGALGPVINVHSFDCVVYMLSSLTNLDNLLALARRLPVIVWIESLAPGVFGGAAESFAELARSSLRLIVSQPLGNVPENLPASRKAAEIASLVRELVH